MSYERLVLSIEPLALFTAVVVVVIITIAEKRAREMPNGILLEHEKRPPTNRSVDFCRDLLTHDFSRRSPRSSVLTTIPRYLSAQRQFCYVACGREQTSDGSNTHFSIVPTGNAVDNGNSIDSSTTVARDFAVLSMKDEEKRHLGLV